MAKNLKLPMPSAAKTPRTTIPRTAGAADMDAVTIGRANKVEKPKSNTPVGRKGKR